MDLKKLLAEAQRIQSEFNPTCSDLEMLAIELSYIQPHLQGGGMKTLELEYKQARVIYLRLRQYLPSDLRDPLRL